MIRHTVALLLASAVPALAQAPQPSSVVGVYVSADGSEGSGVAISPDEVLTASHVLSDLQTGAAWPAADVFATLGPPVQGPSQYGAATTHYNQLGVSETGTETAVDYGVIHLAAALPSSIAPMGLAPEFGGGAVTVCGYPGATALSCQPDNLALGPGTQLPGWQSYVLDGAYYAPGTSGGPAFVAAPAGGYAVVGDFVDDDQNTGIFAAMSYYAVAEIDAWAASDGEGLAVRRLYHGILGRAPDAGGMAYWSAIYLAEEQAASQAAGVAYVAADAVMGGNPAIVEGFLDSAEFQGAHPSISDGDFVTLLYRQALFRAPDAGGFTYWTGLLASGTSRAAVANGICNSAEAVEDMGNYDGF